MLDNRSLKSLRTFTICFLLINIFLNLITYFNNLGFRSPLFEGLTLDKFNHMSIFTLIAIGIGIIFNRISPPNEETKENVKEKIKPLLILNIIFITYIFITIFVIKNKDFIISSIIIEIAYIAIIIFTRSLAILSSNNRKAKWQQAMYGTTYDLNESNIFWRFKIWTSPLESVPFKERYFCKFDIFYGILCIVFIGPISSLSILCYVFLFQALRSFLAFFEYTFGLYTSLNGICTGINYFSKDSKHNEYWRVYITDFKNKREIVYETFKCPYFSNNDDVKVIHGMFSKKVIIANDMKVLYR